MIFSGKHARRDKQFLRLEREFTRLSRAQWNAPIVPLERAYQRGWTKSYVLRADAKRHPEARIFSEILPFVNQQVHAARRDFAHGNGNHIVLRPRVINCGTWRKLAWSFRHQRLFAYGRWLARDLPPGWVPCERDHVIGFKLVSCWWLEEIISPRMITHQRVDLPEVRRRLAEIEAFFSHRSGWERLRRLHGRRVRWRESRDSIAVRRESAIACPDQPD